MIEDQEERELRLRKKPFEKAPETREEALAMLAALPAPKRAAGAAERVGIGHRLAQARERAGLTQAATAAAMGKQRTLLAKIETGVLSPSMEFLTLFAAAVGASMDEWCGWMRRRGGEVSEAFVAGFDAGRLEMKHLLERPLADEVAAVSEATRAGGGVGETERETLSRLVRLGLEVDRRGGF